MHTSKNKQYVHKRSRLYNNACVSKPEVSPRNTRHERAQQILIFCLAGVLLRTCHPHIPPTKNRWRIFIMPVPLKKVFTNGNNSVHGFGLIAGFWGCRDRHYKISVIVQGWFYERGAFQAMQKWTMKILLYSRHQLYGERLALRGKNQT